MSELLTEKRALEAKLAASLRAGGGYAARVEAIRRRLDEVNAALANG